MKDEDCNVPSLTDEQQKQVERALRELSDSFTRKEAENDLISDIVKRLHEATRLPTKMIRRMAKAYHNGSFQLEVMFDEGFHDVYQQITKEGTN